MTRRQSSMAKVFIAALAMLLVTVIPYQEVAADNSYIPQYRMYNTRTGEHFYTTAAAERNQLVKTGIWNYEGINCLIPAISDTPMYRLYNKATGFHHYTTSVKERDVCVSRGWIYEGIGWYSGGDTEVYRLYHPHSGIHHYTSSIKERDSLVKNGWSYEGVSWYGMSATNYQDPNGAPPVVSVNIAKGINGATQADINKLNAQINRIPEKLRDEFVNAGWTIYATAEDLSKTRYDGDDKDDVIIMGVTVAAEKAIYISRDAWFDTIGIHEFAHFVDYQRGFPSRSEEFSNITKSEMTTLKSRVPTGGFLYGAEEFFSETFVYLLIDPSKCTPEAAKFVSKYM